MFSYILVDVDLIFTDFDYDAPPTCTYLDRGGSSSFQFRAFRDYILENDESVIIIASLPPSIYHHVTCSATTSVTIKDIDSKLLICYI